jgi:hypothetical protein
MHAELKHGFQDEAVVVLRDLRRTTATVLAGCSGVDRAVDVAKRLNLDRSLAWKVWQVGQGTGPCPSPAHIPGKAAFGRFLEAASAVGVASVNIEAAREAYARLERLTVEHAGNRAAAGSMLGTLTDEGRVRMETAIRRDGFRAAAHFLGVQALALLQIDVLLPNPAPGCLPDVIRLRGMMGLRRHRAGVPWVVARTTLMHREGPVSALTRAPLAGEAQGVAAALSAGAPPALLAPFCSSPLPEVERRVINGVTVEDELQPGVVGQTGAVDVVLGERISRIPRAGADVEALVMHVATPAERLCYDLLIPEGLLEREPALRVHSTVHGEFPFARRPDFDLIPIPEALHDLGPATDAPAAADIPRHDEIHRWLLSRLGASPERFRMLRLRMKYPPTPICIAASYASRPST